MSTFEFDGEKYKKASKAQKEWGGGLISELELAGTEAVLDLGCGDGALTEQIAQLVPEGKVVGIDASEGMIRTAKKREKEKLTFEQMDIDHMEYQQEFDVIFSNAALHWVKKHDLLLANAYAALRKNGTIHWDFGGAGNCANFYGVTREVIAMEEYRDYFKNFEWPWYMPSVEEYEEKLAASKFEEYQVCMVNRDRYFASEEELIMWIDQPCIVPFLTCLPERVKADFRAEVIRRMLERSRQSDGTCFETFRRVHVWAKKTDE